MEGSEVFQENSQEVKKLSNEEESSWQSKKFKCNYHNVSKKAFQSDLKILEEVLANLDARKWKQAMKEKLKNLQKNET